MAHQRVFIRSDFNLLGWGFVVHVCIRLGKVCALCLFTNELIKWHHLLCRSNTVEKEAGLLCYSLFNYQYCDILLYGSECMPFYSDTFVCYECTVRLT